MGSKTMVVAWQGRTSVMAIPLAEGPAAGTRKGVSHKRHAFKEGLADRRAGDT